MTNPNATVQFLGDWSQAHNGSIERNGQFTIDYDLQRLPHWFMRDMALNSVKSRQLSVSIRAARSSAAAWLRRFVITGICLGWSEDAEAS